MLAPKNIATCSNGGQPNQPEGRITIERATARPEQLAAWRRLWAKLLAVPTATSTANRLNEGKASIRRSNEQIKCQDDKRND
jgi:hypothetical protein